MTPTDSTRPTKADWRARFRAYRDALDDRTYEALSRAIDERAAALSELEAARVVHVYWPLTARREVDTRPLVRWLHAQKKQIVLPFVRTFGDGEEAPRLGHRPFVDEAALRPNRWGIFEPEDGEDVPLDTLDLVVVPAFGIDRSGRRIGHGFGYYDAFLGAVRALRVGLIYEACFVERLPAEAHDVPVDVVVTEERTWRVRHSATS